ncbi:hypothetical protein KC343_g33 [Hortaea werneckii]|nr:hypothetical protein KC317_g34 [Hortaea werneckii]KAI7638487.1 hypothetical protein KC343_g33 [Hortaea werneckii]
MLIVRRLTCESFGDLCSGGRCAMKIIRSEGIATTSAAPPSIGNSKQRKARGWKRNAPHPVDICRLLFYSHCPSVSSLP